MSKNHIRFGGVLAALVAGAVAVLAQTPTPVVAYDNTTYLGSFYGNAFGYEFGDEVVLEGFGSHDYLNVTYIEISYSVPESFVPEPGVKVGYVHFYDLTGPTIPTPVPHPSPGAELVPPVEFDLDNVGGSGGAVLEVWQSVVVPRRFVWTVSFEGVGKEDVGLDLADPPSIGMSGNDFWVKEPGGWVLHQIDNGNTPANFYARILAIPEPSTLELLVLAGAAGLWLLRRRS